MHDSDLTELVLYVGADPASARTRARIEALIAGRETVSLTVRDLAASPLGPADRDHVDETPTLIKRAPGPETWVIGEITDERFVAAVVG